MKKSFFSVGIVLCIMLLLISCYQDKDERMSQILDFNDKYMEAYKIGTSESVRYCHFEDESIIPIALESNMRCHDYRVERVEKVNDNLYLIVNLIENCDDLGIYHRAYNFIGIIDSKMCFMLNKYQIPVELRTGLDKINLPY